MSKPTFILSTEDINSYGSRIKTGGIDLERFQKNPVMFAQHSRWSGIIGKWENIRIENGQLLADAVFDEKNALGKEVKRQVTEGFLVGCSVGLEIIELSDEEVAMGQSRPTITKSRLMEASIVDIPSNPNTVKLAAGALNHAELLTLSKDGVIITPDATPEVLNNIFFFNTDMNPSAKPVNTGGEEKTLLLKLQEAEEKLKAFEAKQKEEVSENLKKTGYFSAETISELSQYPELAGRVVAELSAQKQDKPEIRITDLLQKGSGEGSPDKEELDAFAYYQKHGQEALDKIQKENPAKFKTMMDKAYGEGSWS